MDASYGVYHDTWSRKGGSLSLGRGTIFTKSTRQKLNYKNSTEAELVAATEVLPQILRTRFFLENHGVGVRKKLLYQDSEGVI